MNDICGELQPHAPVGKMPYKCSLPRGHRGCHIAELYGTVLAQWSRGRARGDHWRYIWAGWVAPLYVLLAWGYLVGMLMWRGSWPYAVALFVVTLTLIVVIGVAFDAHAQHRRRYRSRWHWQAQVNTLIEEIEQDRYER